MPFPIGIGMPAYGMPACGFHSLTKEARCAFLRWWRKG